MIPVAPVDPPPSFEAKVRRRGLDAISELVGESPSRTRRGRKRTRTFASRSSIPAAAFPDYWTVALDDLREAYHNLCAYLGLYLERGTGSASVDHFVPKSKSWQLVYEWSNYRLCSSLINGHKGDREISLDPFTLEAGLFALEFTEFQVVPGPRARGPLHDTVVATIDDLGLNQRDCRKAREEYVSAYRDGPPGGIALERLEVRAPFIAQELRRQGELVRGDA